MGYCLFSITCSNGEVETNLNQDGQSELNSFGPDNSYSLGIYSTGYQTRKFKQKNGILYECICFTVDGDYDETVYLVDKNEEEDSITDSKYVYTIERDSKAKEYHLTKETTLFVSSIGARIMTSEKIEDTIMAVYQDKETRMLFDFSLPQTERTFGASTREVNHTTIYEYNLLFKKSIELNQIDCIQYGKHRIRHVK